MIGEGDNHWLNTEQESVTREEGSTRVPNQVNEEQDLINEWGSASKETCLK